MEMTPVRPFKFLVCVDARDESRTALRLACHKARKRGGLVDIVHVIPPVDFQTLGLVAEKMREERRMEAEKILQSLADEAFAAYGITPSFIIREGAIGDEIVACASEDEGVTMLVLGVAPQGSRGTLVAWLAGQLGTKLFTPLLLIPGNLTEAQMDAVI